jgi:RNA-binding protein
MNDMNSSQRKQLRALAHHLTPVSYVGKNGLSPALIESVRVALDDHELIKVKFIEGKEERKASSEKIAAETDSNLVGLIGNIAILYREHPDPEKRTIALTE